MSNLEKVIVMVLLIVVLGLIYSMDAKADTQQFYLDADCLSGMEFAWLVPAPKGGTHRSLPNGWVAETPLWKTWKEFQVLFAQGCKLGMPCYNIVYDLDRNRVINSNDFTLLVKLWSNTPEVVGDLNRVEFGKAMVGSIYPARACVTLDWSPVYFDPNLHLFQACIEENGSTQITGPNGGQWRGPASNQTVDANNCMGEF